MSRPPAICFVCYSCFFTVGTDFCSLSQMIVALDSAECPEVAESWRCQQIAMPSGRGTMLWAQQGGPTSTAGTSQDLFSIFSSHFFPTDVRSKRSCHYQQRHPGVTLHSILTQASDKPSSPILPPLLFFSPLFSITLIFLFFTLFL